MPDVAQRGVSSKDLQHLPQCFRRKILLLKPHTITKPAEGPHSAGVTLERSNATQQELLHHLVRCHA